jgi:hypothetical protein
MSRLSQSVMKRAGQRPVEVVRGISFCIAFLPVLDQVTVVLSPCVVGGGFCASRR